MLASVNLENEKMNILKDQNKKKKRNKKYNKFAAEKNQPPSILNRVKT